MAEHRRSIWNKKRSKKEKQHKVNNTLRKDYLRNKKDKKNQDFKEFEE